MASDVTEVDAGRPRALDAPKPARRAVRPHRRRFLVLYGTLAAALAAAVVGIVVFAGRSIHPAPAWSAWKPSGGGLGAAKQIAAHVGHGYLLPSGVELVAPIAAPPLFSDGKTVLPISVLAVTGPQGKIRDLIPITASDTIMYSLCGLGRLCSIASGTPSVARGALVRREILELALYTFRYLHGVQNVVAFEPPVAGSRIAVYLQRSEVEPELRRPLAVTLEPTAPSIATIVQRTREVATLRRLVLPHLYSTRPTPTQQGEGVLVLRALA